MDLKNWKLVECAGKYEIISYKPNDFIYNIANNMNAVNYNISGFSRHDTNFDWNKINPHYNFFFDFENNEDVIKKALAKAINFNKIIITYYQESVAILIDINLFINDWEDFIASTHFETCIFSPDYKFILEVSRDYYMHSNFYIYG